MTPLSRKNASEPAEAVILPCPLSSLLLETLLFSLLFEFSRVLEVSEDGGSSSRQAEEASEAAMLGSELRLGPARLGIDCGQAVFHEFRGGGSVG